MRATQRKMMSRAVVEHGARVVRLELGSLVRPAEGRERVERRGEPRVEHVLLLAQLPRAALGARARRLLRDREVPVGAVPDGDPVAPPDLPRDAPGADVPHPVEVDAREALRREADAPLLDGAMAGAASSSIAHHHWSMISGSTRVWQRSHVGRRGDRLLSLEEPRSRAHSSTRSPASACVSPASSPASSLIRPSRPITASSGSPCSRPISKSIGSCPGVTLSAPVPNSGSTCSSATIGTRRSTKGTIDLLADELAVALVVRVDGDGDVGEDRRRPHGRDRHVARAVRERVADVRERVVDLLRLELEVGERRSVARAPVRDPVVAVDPAASVQVDEPADDRPVVALVHREARARVVERGADTTELRHDRPAVAGEPVLDVRVEALAPEIALALPLLRECPPDRRPGRDPRVVVAGLEERVEPAHPVPAHERVLERELEHVADGQRARDVRRRVHDDERLVAARAGAGAVEALGLPCLLPARLDFRRGVAGIHGGRV